MRCGCTLWLYVMVVRYGCTLWLYIMVVRYGCNMLKAALGEGYILHHIILTCFIRCTCHLIRWVAIFNNAPYAGLQPASSAALQLRVRYNLGSLFAVAGPLCPSDCSGQGSCSNPPTFIAPVQPSYACTCNAGFGGPYCQGQMLNPLTLSPGASLSSGQVGHEHNKIQLGIGL